MVLHEVRIQYDDKLRLRGLSDAHIGARAAEEKRLKKDIDTILSEKDSYVILLGDQVEAIVRQDLVRFNIKSVREDLVDEVDSLLNAQLREAIKTFKPLADEGRIIGALMGNHELQVKKRFSFDLHSELCERLHIKNLGYSCMIRIQTKKGKKATTRALNVYCHHGHGGTGRKSGASINRMEDLAGEWDADIFLMGHNHKRHTSKQPLLGMTSNGIPRLVEKSQVFIRTGGYYKTYQEGVDPSYGEIAGYKGVYIGEPPYVDIWEEGHYHDIKMKVTE